MKADIPQQPSPASNWSRRLAVFSAALLLTSGAGHRFGFIETVPFLWLLGIGGLLAVGALILGGIALARVWENGNGRAGSAVMGIILGCLVLTPFAVSAVRMLEYPRLIDISTDLEDPPRLMWAAELRDGAMNAVQPISQEAATLQSEHYPQITGRRYEHAADTVLLTVRILIDERKWRLLGPEHPSFRDGRVTFEVEAKSFLLGFPSDVAIRLVDDGTATYVDMRSASRYGRHDLGENAQRIRRFLTELDELMAQQAAL